MYITNLGKYTEGELCGAFLKLPATKQDVQSLLSRIGVDGVLYEEIFITDYETDVSGLHKSFGEYESVDELNYLAALLSEMDGGELELFSAALDLGEDCGSVQALINLTQNLDCYDYFPGISDYDDLGRYLIEELECQQIPEWMEPYFDYEAYGRDFSINDGGQFAENGYIMRGYGSITEYYSGRDDIPDEHRIFAYPDPPRMRMKDQLEMYGRMAAAQATDRFVPVREGMDR